MDAFMARLKKVITDFRKQQKKGSDDELITLCSLKPFENNVVMRSLNS